MKADLPFLNKSMKERGVKFSVERSEYWYTYVARETHETHHPSNRKTLCHYLRVSVLQRQFQQSSGDTGFGTQGHLSNCEIDQERHVTESLQHPCHFHSSVLECEVGGIGEKIGRKPGEIKIQAFEARKMPPFRDAADFI